MDSQMEAKKEKKASKIFFGMAKLAGVAVGLLILSLISPFIYDGEATGLMQDLFIKYSLYLLFCVFCDGGNLCFHALQNIHYELFNAICCFDISDDSFRV